MPARTHSHAGKLMLATMPTIGWGPDALTAACADVAPAPGPHAGRRGPHSQGTPRRRRRRGAAAEDLLTGWDARPAVERLRRGRTRRLRMCRKIRRAWGMVCLAEQRSRLLTLGLTTRSLTIHGFLPTRLWHFWLVSRPRNY